MTTPTRCRQCSIRPVNTPGTLCNECACKGEMPEADCEGTSPTHDPDIGSYYEWRGWHVDPDGTTSIERYAVEQFRRGENNALREIAPLVGAEHMPTYHNVKRKATNLAAENARLREAMHCAILKIQDGAASHAEGVLEGALAGV